MYLTGQRLPQACLGNLQFHHQGVAAGGRLGSGTGMAEGGRGVMIGLDRFLICRFNFGVIRICTGYLTGGSKFW